MKKKTVFALLIGFVLFVIAGAVWGVRFLSYQSMPEGIRALKSDEQVVVRQEYVKSWLNYYYVFEPRTGKPSKGFIIYPGGFVAPEAYVPIARDIAAKGYRTAIVCVPLNLAILGYKRVDTIISEYGDIKKWAIGGHSLGGVAACRYAKKFTGKIDGVVLWASYPSDTFRLDDRDVKAVSIYGGYDALATPDKIETSKMHLPEDTLFVKIEGGNHTQFGWYGDGKELQKGDSPAGITREQQQAGIVKATAGFLEGL